MQRRVAHDPGQFHLLVGRPDQVFWVLELRADTRSIRRRYRLSGGLGMLGWERVSIDSSGSTASRDTAMPAPWEQPGKVVLETPRTRLREWTIGDVDALIAICADPEVMALVWPGHPLSRNEAQSQVQTFMAEQAEIGHTLWVLEHDRDVVGFVGLIRSKRAWFPPGTVEIGWRLRRDHWGKGLASEAAKAVLDEAARWAPDQPIIAVTDARNLRSQRVMQRIDMRPVGRVQQETSVSESRRSRLVTVYVGLG